VAVPSLPTTIAGRRFASTAPSASAAPAASASASVATTLSPAPVTSNTSRAAVGMCSGFASAHEQAHARARPA
jgi:hypothetical protein